MVSHLMKMDKTSWTFGANDLLRVCVICEPFPTVLGHLGHFRARQAEMET